MTNLKPNVTSQLDKSHPDLFPSITKPIPTKSSDDPRPLVIVSMTVMTVVHSVKVSTMYTRVVISSPFGD
jgi:hypothetical protein